MTNDSSNDFLIIGHRGAAGLELENSLASFKRALDLGVDALEFDVHRVENHLVVIHDDDVKRTTSGKGPLSSFTYDQLRELHLKNGEQIPILKEAFDVIPPDIIVNVELKGRDTGSIAARNLNRLAHPVMVSSFHREELVNFMMIASSSRDYQVGLLCHKVDHDHLEEARWVNANSINLNIRGANAKSINEARDMGFQVLVFAVNDVAKARELRELGVSGVFTDRPDVVTKAAVCA